MCFIGNSGKRCANKRQYGQVLVNKRVSGRFLRRLEVAECRFGTTDRLGGLLKTPAYQDRPYREAGSDRGEQHQVLTFVSLVLIYGRQYLGQAGTAVIIDLVMVILFVIYMFSDRQKITNKI